MRTALDSEKIVIGAQPQCLERPSAATHVRWLAHRRRASRVVVLRRSRSSCDGNQSGQRTRHFAAGRQTLPSLAAHDPGREPWGGVRYSSPIRRIDQDLWNRREEIPIRKYANTTNKAPPIPGTDVHGLGQRAGGVVQGVLAGPHPLCESEEIGGLKPFSENQVSHVEIDVAI